MKTAKNKGRFVLFVGISGAGKNTVMRGLSDKLAREGRSVSTVVSTTTRRPRRDEVHGEDYLFRDTVEFTDMIRKGKFAEHAVVHGCYYGTETDEIVRLRSKSDFVLHDIDIQGAAQVLRLFPDATSVLISVSPAKVEERLEKRGELKAGIVARKYTSLRELTAFKSFPFDIRISNDSDDPADAVDLLFAALKAS